MILQPHRNPPGCSLITRHLEALHLPLAFLLSLRRLTAEHTNHRRAKFHSHIEIIAHGLKFGFQFFICPGEMTRRSQVTDGQSLSQALHLRVQQIGRVVIAEADITAQIDDIQALFIGQLDEALDIRQRLWILTEHGRVESDFHWL